MCETRGLTCESTRPPCVKSILPAHLSACTSSPVADPFQQLHQQPRNQDCGNRAAVADAGKRHRIQVTDRGKRTIPQANTRVHPYTHGGREGAGLPGLLACCHEGTEVITECCITTPRSPPHRHSSGRHHARPPTLRQSINHQNVDLSIHHNRRLPGRARYTENRPPATFLHGSLHLHAPHLPHLPASNYEIDHSSCSAAP